MAKEKQEKDLKAFLVTYLTETDKDYKHVIVVAFKKKEAGKLFVQWAITKNLYNSIKGVVVQQVRKTKQNAKFYTLDFYYKQFNGEVKDIRKVTA